MRKNLFFVAAAALVLASCNNDVKLDENVALADSNAQKEIAFSLYAHGPKHVAADTYDGPIDGAAFPHDLNMYVAAYEVSPEAGDYFGSTQFVYGNAGGSAVSSGHWGGATAKYWPLSPCYINFLAVANIDFSTPGNSATWGTDDADFASKVVIAMTDNSTSQNDLMYAIGNGEVTQSGNTLVFPPSVPMEFKHAQAWIDFYVKGATAAEVAAIKINSITLNDAYYAGTYTITHGNYNANAGQTVSGAWTSPDAQDDVIVPGIAPAGQALTDTYAHAGNGLLVVPNGFTSFTINYSFNGEDYDYTYTPLNTTLEQAKHYIYNVVFTLHEIFVDATVADWTDVTTFVPVVSTGITMDKDDLADVTLDNAAGTYSFVVSDLTDDDAASVAVKTDGDHIITNVTVSPTVADNKVTIEVTKPATVNNKTATITLSVGATPTTYDITIKTPTE